MLSIHLHNIILFAFHGIYEEEKILGNEFELNITVAYSPKKIPIKHLQDTIDYIAVYELVKKRMAISTPLLETLASEMAEEILATFFLAEKVSISIKKLYPPVSQFKGNVGVSFELRRK